MTAVFRWPLSRYFASSIYILLVLAVVSGRAQAEDKELADDQVRQECFKGQTIYCLALGLREERAGHQERALELYRLACKNHPTPGHLRACTPLLTLALQMGRMKDEAEPLEARCREGNTVTCFYLGKEYLKVAGPEQAARLLQPLCRERFHPPDPEDYGSCYHLAKGFEQTGQWNRARELFQWDCEGDPRPDQPSCAALTGLAELEQAHSRLRQQGIRSPRLLEGVLLLTVLMSCLHVLIWFKGGRTGKKYLSVLAPIIIGGGSLAWIFWPGKPAYPQNQWAVVFFVLLLALGMAVCAGLHLRSFRIPPSLTGSPSGESPSQ